MGCLRAHAASGALAAATADEDGLGGASPPHPQRTASSDELVEEISLCNHFQLMHPASTLNQVQRKILPRKFPPTVYESYNHRFRRSLRFSQAWRA